MGSAGTPAGRRRTAVILQPGYLPWLGFFDQLYKSDVFVVYDDVQFDKNGWRNRNRIKGPHGPQWLTVPVLLKGQGRPTNREVRINPAEGWARKHLTALRQNYARAAYLDAYIDLFEEVYAREWTHLIDLSLELMFRLMGALGLEREVRLASELDVPGSSTERLVGICRAVGADRLLEGDAGQDYIDPALFEAEGIELRYHGYRHPEYRQLHDDFVPYLSVVDLLLNEGEASLGILVDADNDQGSRT